jgi:hypothetical protein
MRQRTLATSRLPAAAVAVWMALGAACGVPPVPEEPADLVPCTALRRQVCGSQDECVAPGPTADDCDRCKSRLCRYVRTLEADQNQPVCLAEFRTRPEYPVCRAPKPLPTLAPPPLVVRVQCERECSLIPAPPEPPPPEDQF